MPETVRRNCVMQESRLKRLWKIQVSDRLASMKRASCDGADEALHSQARLSEWRSWGTYLFVHKRSARCVAKDETRSPPLSAEQVNACRCQAATTAMPSVVSAPRNFTSPQCIVLWSSSAEGAKARARRGCKRGRVSEARKGASPAGLADEVCNSSAAHGVRQLSCNCVVCEDEEGGDVRVRRRRRLLLPMPLNQERGKSQGRTAVPDKDRRAAAGSVV